jgi:hypothetical protein
VADALMEPEMDRDSLLQAPGNSPIEQKLNLEAALQARQQDEFDRLTAQGRNLGKLFLLNRTASYDWLHSMTQREGSDHATIGIVNRRESRHRTPLAEARELSAVDAPFGGDDQPPALRQKTFSI